MNGIHDMGGMHGFGAVDVDDDAPFHSDWDRTVFAVEKLLRYQSIYGVDEKRHAIERISPTTYLEASYYERWALGAETLLHEIGTVQDDEFEAAIDDHDGTGLLEIDRDEGESADDELVEVVHEGFRSDADYEREPVEPRFEEGEEVVVRNAHPSGHTRCPRYVRRTTGTVETVRGTHVVPDEAVDGKEVAEPLYGVRFDAADLWNDDTDGDAVYVDLWQRYLEATEETKQTAQSASE